MTFQTDYAGLAALAICASLLLAMYDRGLLLEHEIFGVLRDAATTHENAVGRDGERERHLAVVDLIETGRSGVYHAVNSSSTTWHDFAEAILRLSRIDVPLRRTSAEKLGRAARRPAYSVLDQAPLPEVLNRGMPSWQEALREYFVLRGEPRRGD